MKKIYVIVFLVLTFALFSGCAHTRVVGASPLSTVFQRVNPAVVVILTSQRGYSREKPGETVTEGGLGSGVVISRDGLVMTAAHVVQVADTVAVQFLDGHKMDAKVVGSVTLADVALLKLHPVPDNLVVAKLGDSDKVTAGDQVFVVGAPYGIQHTLTVGYVSGRRRPKNFSDQLVPIEFLQIDAAVNQGNSGGPLFNMKGEVVGIVSYILSQSGGFEGLGFAASINIAKELLLKQKSFWTGLEFYFLTEELAKVLNVPQKAGLLIQRVAENSPGHDLGFRPGTIPVKIGNQGLLIGGDIVLEVQGIPISNDMKAMRKIREMIQERRGLTGLEFKVLRGGKIVNLSKSD